MEKWQGAVIKEQGVTFAVMVVKPHVLNSPSEREKVIAALTIQMRMPVVLAASKGNGIEYWGQPDLSNFMATVPPHLIPWQEITFS